MALPFFYIGDLDASSTIITLNEETSKHVVQVLRMKEGEELNLTDGKGNLLTAEITNAHKRNCAVRVKATSNKPQNEKKVSIAISLVKNASRFEWFLEKATEIGVTEIIPLLCERTERQHFRYDRMNGILVSAMLQSQQTWLPLLHEPTKLDDYIRQMGVLDGVNKFIAHCIETDRQSLSNILTGVEGQINSSPNRIILIGPEGDFNLNEIELALQHQFIPVTLGETRLRTETAGVAAAVLLCIQ
jgi:16S rRNA (uracil1498-N3)-methyltransferase